jgi:A nuclease of the HNH/ENDO VII superfamily with conserved WHH
LKKGGSNHTYIIKPKNGGKSYFRKIKKNQAGHANFSQYTHPTIKPQTIQFTGNRANDIRAANKATGQKKTPAGYTWHHLPKVDKNTGVGQMVLVKKDIHRAVGHNGGAETFRKIFGWGY